MGMDAISTIIIESDETGTAGWVWVLVGVTGMFVVVGVVMCGVYIARTNRRILLVGDELLM